MKTRLQHFLFHRHLLWEFLRRDLQARYVGSAMGFFWSVINPLILLIVYSVVFGFILRVPSPRLGGQVPSLDFAFYIFCGLLPWYAFQESLIRSTTCIIDNQHLIKQIRFPAKVLPAYITLSSLVNQLIGTVILIAVMAVFRHVSPWTLFGLPLVFFLEWVFFFGSGLLFATLNTYLRDIAPLMSIATLVMMWATPMFYEMEIVPPAWQPLLYANPLTYMVLIHHHLVLFNTWPPFLYWMIFATVSLVSFGLGYRVFTRRHQEFADLL